MPERKNRKTEGRVNEKATVPTKEHAGVKKNPFYGKTSKEPGKKRVTALTTAGRKKKPT